jgi:hypothetical protein
MYVACVLAKNLKVTNTRELKLSAAYVGVISNCLNGGSAVSASRLRFATRDNSGTRQTLRNHYSFMEQ